MAAHACLKNEFTGDGKYHNLMAWLKSGLNTEMKQDEYSTARPTETRWVLNSQTNTETLEQQKSNSWTQVGPTKI